uniref:Auxin-responsive protein n=3 Tax=Aegilops tauschii subsp. strangulata TaxID=200361 RepID=A0A452XXL7_AEGTS
SSATAPPLSRLMECKAASESSSSSSAPSSSMDSCGAGGPRATVSTASSCYRPAIHRDLSTDLHLGLSQRSCSSSFHTADGVSASTPRSTLTTTTMRPAAPSPDPAYERGGGGSHGQQSLFVKVYMEGVPIGRKLDLLLLDGYDGLLAVLGRMFKASIIHPDTVGRDHRVVLGEKQARHVVTYQDQEGDWLMAGDVPWELFLAGVKKLKIARVDSSISD